MIRFGPAGFGMPSLKGLEHTKELGLTAAEVEFTYGVRMNNKTAEQLGIKAKKLGIALSVHAPYYINLATPDKKKLANSYRNVLQSCERAHFMHANPVVFHPAFYGKLEKNECYQLVKQRILELKDQIKKQGLKVQLAPETTGKPTQFGSFEEIMRLVHETKCSFCVDFAHLYARNLGKIDYNQLLKQLKRFKHIHAHFSGIEYTEKGEKRHIPLKKAFFLPLAKALLKYKPDITIINESPNIYDDAVKMKKWLEELRKPKK
ncbi:endonuclease IV [Candidatus Woesearchaeota archaeon]|nr:TIM barrel protein [Candidatus Woesearchaeota archaeon]RLE40799.1 MAG: endonuclease IV [Candidatus Woesearchaeota archaeon]